MKTVKLLKAQRTAKQRIATPLHDICSLQTADYSKDISVMSPIVISMPTRELLTGETKSSFVLRFSTLSNKNNVCKQIGLSLLYTF